MVSCASPFKSFAIRGRAGKYISVDKDVKAIKPLRIAMKDTFAVWCSRIGERGMVLLLACHWEDLC